MNPADIISRALTGETDEPAPKKQKINHDIRDLNAKRSQLAKIIKDNPDLDLSKKNDSMAYVQGLSPQEVEQLLDYAREELGGDDPMKAPKAVAGTLGVALHLATGKKGIVEKISNDPEVLSIVGEYLPLYLYSFFKWEGPARLVARIYAIINED